MIGVVVRGWVRRVSDPITGRSGPQDVHRIENLPRNDEVPLAQEPSGILTFFA